MGKDLNRKELGQGLRQRSDGKYIARFQCKSGKRPEKAFEKLTDARAWLNEQKYLDEHTNLLMAKSMTLDTWYQYWIENIKKNTVRDSTLFVYQKRYKDIKAVIGNMPLGEIKPLHCQMVLNNMGGAQSTQNLTKVCMGQLFGSAVDNGLIEKSPVTRNVKVNRSKKEERRVFSVDEQNRFEEYLISSDHKYARAYIFCLETGLRVGEIKALMWSDIHDRRIIINRNMVYVDGKELIHEPKSESGKRMIPLTNKAYRIIRECRKQKIVGQYVFLEDGKHLTTAALNRNLLFVCKKLGIDRISMHGLRHSFATRCIEKGMRPKTLQKILGHATLQMTMDLYVHVTDEALEEEMLKMESGEKVAK